MMGVVACPVPESDAGDVMGAATLAHSPRAARHSIDRIGSPLAWPGAVPEWGLPEPAAWCGVLCPSPLFASCG